MILLVVHHVVLAMVLGVKRRRFQMAKRKKPIKIRYKCALCDDIIVSMHRHDFVMCKCGAIYVDGGDDYTRLGGELYNILMEVEENKFIPFPILSN
jgi:hypothetical protein